MILFKKILFNFNSDPDLVFHFIDPKHCLVSNYLILFILYFVVSFDFSGKDAMSCVLQGWFINKPIDK